MSWDVVKSRAHGFYILKRVFLAVLLSWITMQAIGWMRQAGVSWLSSLGEYLLFPGGYIASIPYSEGIHTGRGGMAWVYWVVLGNLITYAVGWFLVIVSCEKIVAKFSPGE